MFWKYNTLSTSQIDTLLDTAASTATPVKLQDLLAQEDILQECKNQNKKLID